MDEQNDSPNTARQCRRKLLLQKLQIKEAEARLVFAKLLLHRLRRDAARLGRISTA
jgi:hypothetical protein